ncbi:DUF6286 domain-containing protein [Actinoalloteichus caeruleus]|uniref:DUF6286 domain-containing protein n=1 Tax=Actinoalloteichus cyanogriseus TaxID=2893586 RepID=UPI000AF080D0|nr:DUF6286 domain-containing protein [Actinoalloteichus caeruleus]
MRALIRILTTLIGVAVAVVGALTVIEVLWAWWRPASAPLWIPWPQWLDQASTLTWQGTGPRVTAALVALAGLLLVLLSAAARRHHLALHDPAPDVTVTTSSRSLARVVGHRVRAEPGVRSASVTATRAHVTVRAAAAPTDGDDTLRARLLEIVRDLVDDLPLREKPRVTVTIDSSRERRERHPEPSGSRPAAPGLRPGS